MKSHRHPSSAKAPRGAAASPAAGPDAGRGNAFATEQLKARSPEASRAPTAGPSQDDRGPWVAPEEPLKGDLKTRVLKVQVENSTGALQIWFAAGLAQGLYDGMPLTLCSPKGVPKADFNAESVSERLTRAFVQPEIGRITPDQIAEWGTEIVVRPR